MVAVNPTNKELSVTYHQPDDTSQARLSPALWEQSKQVINHREKVARVQEAGRSLIFPLDPENYITAGEKVIKGLRLKGVTHKGQPPRMIAYSDDENFIKQPKIWSAIRKDENGQEIITYEDLPNDPVAAMKLNSAEREQRILQYAVRHGIPVDYPLGYAEFDGLEFEGRAVGLSITGLEELYPPRRLGTQLKLRMQQPPAVQNYREILRDRYLSFSEDLQAAARTTAKAHREGLIHNMIHLDQFGWNESFKTREMKMFDFETAMTWNEMSEDEFVFRLMRGFFRFYAWLADKTDDIFPVGRLEKEPSKVFADAYFADLFPLLSM